MQYGLTCQSPTSSFAPENADSLLPVPTSAVGSKTAVPAPEPPSTLNVVPENKLLYIDFQSCTILNFTSKFTYCFIFSMNGISLILFLFYDP